MEVQALRAKRDDDAVRLGIEAALARRHEKFALSDLFFGPPTATS
jgi:hypothetical protein